MEKNNFQPIVMPATYEQYGELLDVLREHKISYEPLKYFDHSCKYIVNDFEDKNLNAGSVRCIKYNRRINSKIYKRFNRKIFLKSLGIVEEPEFVLPKKWFVTYANFEEFDIINKHFKKGWNHIEGVNENGYFSGDDKYGNNWLSKGDKHKYGKKSLLKNGYIEITFEQFQKYVLKQDISILESQSKTSELKLTDVCVNLYKKPTEQLKDFYDFLIKNNQKIYAKTFNDFLYYQFDSFNGPYVGLALGEDNRWMGINNKRKQISISEIKELILKSQSVTNKQTKMKSTIEEVQQAPVKFKRGDIVKHVNQIYIVTETSPTTCDLLCVHPSHVHGMKQTSIHNTHISLFKGKLTLEQ